MCRIAAYVGPSERLDALLLEPPWSLARQARGPRELPPGTVGSDGFGAAWFSPEFAEPARYRSLLPIWGDENFRGFARHTRSVCVLGSIRVAASNMPIDLSNTPPYVRGRLALVHNGELVDFHRGWMRELRAACSLDEEAGIRGNTDSEHVLALLATRLGAAVTTGALVSALTEVLAFLGALARRVGQEAALNLAVSVGEVVVASRCAVGREPPSLHVTRGAAEHGAWVASEPVFPERAWDVVPPQSLVILEPGASPAVRPIAV